MIESRMTYIHENPVRAGIVGKEEDYLYSSARNPATAGKYSGLNGLLVVTYESNYIQNNAHKTNSDPAESRFLPAIISVITPVISLPSC